MILRLFLAVTAFFFTTASIKAQSQKLPIDNGTMVYSYKRVPIIDSDGRSIIPNIAFLVEAVSDSADVIEFSLEKRIAVPFEVKSMFDWQNVNPIMSFRNAVGYIGEYTQNELAHTVYVIHLVDENCGVQVICDATSQVLPLCNSEFLKLIRSLKTTSHDPRRTKTTTVNASDLNEFEFRKIEPNSPK